MDPNNVAVALAAVAFVGLSFGTWRQAKIAATTLVEKEYEVEKKHVALLKKMVTEHKIKDFNKAVRVAVQYSISEDAEVTGKHTKTTGKEEKEIWEKKRCNTCGGKKDKEKVKVKLYPKMVGHLEAMQKKYTLKSTDKSLRCLLEYCEDPKIDKAKIFSDTNMRCKNC